MLEQCKLQRKKSDVLFKLLEQEPGLDPNTCAKTLIRTILTTVVDAAGKLSNTPQQDVSIPDVTEEAYSLTATSLCTLLNCICDAYYPNDTLINELKTEITSFCDDSDLSAQQQCKLEEFLVRWFQVCHVQFPKHAKHTFRILIVKFYLKFYQKSQWQIFYTETLSKRDCLKRQP